MAEEDVEQLRRTRASVGAGAGAAGRDWL